MSSISFQGGSNRNIYDECQYKQWCSDNNIPFKSVTNHISDCVHKRCNSWHGFKWYYANDPNQPDKTKIVI